MTNRLPTETYIGTANTLEEAKDMIFVFTDRPGSRVRVRRDVCASHSQLDRESVV